MDAATAVPAIDARKLAFGYPLSRGETVPVLADLDLVVPPGEFLTILGPSGCGKSSFLRVVADLLAPLAGHLAVLGRPPSEARRQRRVAFVFQDATLLPWRTVRQNVELPLQVGPARGSKPPSAAVGDWLTLLGLSGLAGRYPHQLSGGQRQRVSIARALLCDPSVLLMDEPFGALDEITRDRLNDELLAAWRRTRPTVLFVTHSVTEAAYLGQRVLVLAADPGRVAAVVDTVAFKDADNRCSRDNRGLAEAVSRLRHVLHTGASPA